MKQKYCGKRWTNENIATLGEKDKRKVLIKDVTNGRRFRFGGGKAFTDIKEVKAPVRIGSKHYNLSWFVVNTPISLLWGKESIKKAEVLLDLPQDRAKVKGDWLEHQTAKGSHYRIELLLKTKDTKKFDILFAEGHGSGVKMVDVKNDSEDKK